MHISSGSRARLITIAIVAFSLFSISIAYAHGVDADDKAFIQRASGTQVLAYS
jgi:hypothetical protein